MKQHNIIIRQETPADYAAVEHLTREAFWNVYRPGCLEHYVVHVLRNDPAFVPELDLVMEQDGALIGHVLYMRAIIKADDGREIPMMTFGPISIRPDLQRRGLGKYLLDYSMEKAKELGTGILCIEGNLDFYGKSGFVLAGTLGIRYHGEPEQRTKLFILRTSPEKGKLFAVLQVVRNPVIERLGQSSQIPVSHVAVKRTRLGSPGLFQYRKNVAEGRQTGSPVLPEGGQLEFGGVGDPLGHMEQAGNLLIGIRTELGIL